MLWNTFLKGALAPLDDRALPNWELLTLTKIESDVFSLIL